jgi:DNA polymerase III subunit delta'
MAWPEIVGNVPVVARLERALAEGTLPHAILLSGPDGVGKTAIAERLAAGVLDAAGWPGGLTAHPDHWLEDSDTERISIDRVRSGGGSPEAGPSLQDFLALRPYAGGGRVAVMGRADRMTEPAADCVLKTLEEPPPGTCIVLCAAHPERLPATILSRCQGLALAPVPAQEIAAWLTRTQGTAAATAHAAAHLAGGRPGRALALATAPGAMAAELDAVDAFLEVAGSGRADLLRAAERLAPPRSAEGWGRAVGQGDVWTGFLRDVACVAAGASELATWEAYSGAARSWAEALPAARVTGMLARCVRTTDQLAQYAVPRLCYEVLLLDIFGAVPAPPRVEPPPRDPDLAPAGPPPTSTSRPRARSRRA